MIWLALFSILLVLVMTYYNWSTNRNSIYLGDFLVFLASTKFTHYFIVFKFQPSKTELDFKLSLARAQAVADFLIEGGIDPVRIIVRALGEDEPAIDTEREAALNRRVVITENKD